MSHNTHDWRREFKKFPSSLYPWNTETALFNAAQAHQEYLQHKNEASYRNQVVVSFHMPFHSEVLKRVQSKHLREFFTTVYTYKGSEYTFLEQLSHQLFHYHIVCGGNRPEGIFLGRESLLRLRLHVKELKRHVHDLNELLTPVARLSSEPMFKNGNFIYTRIVPHIPGTDCSVELKMQKYQKSA